MDVVNDRAKGGPLSARWWITDKDGRVVLGQAPNPALALWLVSLVVGWTHLLDEDRTEIVRWLGKGGLVVWALDELARGSTPARRVMGATVLGLQLWWLFR